MNENKTKEEISEWLERYYELLYDGAFDYLFENEDEDDE